MRWARVAATLLLVGLLGACRGWAEPATYEVTEVDESGSDRVTVRVESSVPDRDERWEGRPRRPHRGAVRTGVPGAAAVLRLRGAGLLPRGAGTVAGGVGRRRHRLDHGVEIHRCRLRPARRGLPGAGRPGRAPVVEVDRGAGGHRRPCGLRRQRPRRAAYRSVNGVWHRLGIPRGGEGWYFEEPPRLASEPPPADPSWLVALLVTVLLGVAGPPTMVVRRMWRGYDIGLTAGTAVVGGLLSYSACQVPGAGMLSRPDVRRDADLRDRRGRCLLVVLLGVGRGSAAAPVNG